MPGFPRKTWPFSLLAWTSWQAQGLPSVVLLGAWNWEFFFVLSNCGND